MQLTPVYPDRFQPYGRQAPRSTDLDEPGRPSVTRRTLGDAMIGNPGSLVNQGVRGCHNV